MLDYFRGGRGVMKCFVKWFGFSLILLICLGLCGCVGFGNPISQTVSLLLKLVLIGFGLVILLLIILIVLFVLRGRNSSNSE